MAYLRASIDSHGSQSKWAQAHGMSPAYVSFVMTGRKRITTRMVQALGFRRVDRMWERPARPGTYERIVKTTGGKP